MSDSINQTGLVRFKYVFFAIFNITFKYFFKIRITNPNASAPIARFRGSASFPIKSYYGFTIHPGS